MFHRSVNFVSKGKIAWAETQRADKFPEHTIDLWRIPVADDNQQLEAMFSLLNPAESERAGRYRNERDKNRFITSRGMLRILLAEYLKQRPEDIQFSKGANKKPFLINNGCEALEYNVSHSGRWIVIVFGSHGIGIDIEKADESFDYEPILRSGFNKSEIDYVQRSENKTESFYLLWTRKEALLKATAKGLMDDLSLINSLDGLHIIEEHVIESAFDWSIYSFEVQEKYVCSVACNPMIKEIRFFNREVPAKVDVQWKAVKNES